MALQKRGDTERQLAMSILALADPGRHIGRKPESGMIDRGDMRDDAIDRAYLNARADTPCALGKYGTGRVRMRQDEEPCAFTGDGGFTSIVGAAGGFTASCRRFHHDEPGIRSQCGMNAGITHVVKSAISSRSTALRTALQKGASFSWMSKTDRWAQQRNRTRWRNICFE